MSTWSRSSIYRSWTSKWSVPSFNSNFVNTRVAKRHRGICNCSSIHYATLSISLALHLANVSSLSSFLQLIQQSALEHYFHPRLGFHFSLHQSLKSSLYIYIQRTTNSLILSGLLLARVSISQLYIGNGSEQKPCWLAASFQLAGSSSFCSLRF